MDFICSPCRRKHHTIICSELWRKTMYKLCILSIHHVEEKILLQSSVRHSFFCWRAIHCFSRYPIFLSSDIWAYVPWRLGGLAPRGSVTVAFATMSVVVFVMSLDGERPADGCEEFSVCEQIKSAKHKYNYGQWITIDILDIFNVHYVKELTDMYRR